MVYGLDLCHGQPQNEPIVVNGDKVEYFHERKEVIGSGNISITYKDVLLTCDGITVNLETRDAVASGNVRITQKGAYFTGNKIKYNFDTRAGSVMEGYVSAKPFYGKAQEVDKPANKDQFMLQRGYVTTCDLDKPHYRIQSRQVKIYLGDKVVARHILFFIGDVPVMYLPYYEQPLDQAKTHITVIPGESKDWGYYLLTAYRYYINDANRGDILLDYRTKKGLGEGLNHYFDTSSFGSGAFKFYNTHKNDRLAYDKTGDGKPRNRYQFRHMWDMGEGPDTIATVEFNKLSDRDVIKDYFYNEFEELGDTPDNYISFVTQKQDFSTELLLRKRFDNFYAVVERLPEYKIDINSFRIGESRFYLTSNSAGSYLNKTFDITIYPDQKDLDAVRFDTYNQISYAANLLGSLAVTPYAGTRQTYYSRNKWGDTNLIRNVFSGGVNNQIKFYKVYDVRSNFLGLDIDKLRHIITPSANYYYTHQPTISLDNLNQFDSVDSIEAQNGVRLALENRLQTRRGAEESKSSVDLATLIVSSDYMFRLKKDNMGMKSDKFKSVDFQLELIPYSWAYILSKMSIDTKRYIIQTASIDLVASGGERWSAAVSTRFEHVETGTNNLLTADATYKINDKWKVRLYERFNATKKSFEETEFTIFRDIHCWIAEIIYNIKSVDDQGLWIVFRLKAFPDYPVGVKRTYSRARFGSNGNQ